MNDTFDFTSYVRSGRLAEVTYSLSPQLLDALSPFQDSYVVIGSNDWNDIKLRVQEVTGFEDIGDNEDLKDFLTGDFTFEGGYFSDYMERLDIRIESEDYEFPDAEPHQTSDTGSQPRGIGEVINEVLKSKFNKSI